MRHATVTILVENTAASPQLHGVHGLAVWIQTPDHRVLFDTGPSAQALAHNAAQLGIDLDTADAVVLSHGHTDHSGGLDALSGSAGQRLLLHPAALGRRYSRHADASVHEIGMPPEIEAELHARFRVEWVDRPLEVVPGVMATGPVPRINGFEDTGGAFFLDAACTRVDPIPDDQSLFFRTAAGVVVILGCAHAGVVNTVRRILDLAGRPPVLAILGGMHLAHASDDRMAATLEAFAAFDPGVLGPAHCTGAEASERIRSAFAPSWRSCRAGDVFEFGPVPGR